MTRTPILSTEVHEFNDITDWLDNHQKQVKITFDPGGHKMIFKVEKSFTIPPERWAQLKRQQKNIEAFLLS